MERKSIVYLFILHCLSGITFGADNQKPYECVTTFNIQEGINAIDFKRTILAAALCSQGIRVWDIEKNTVADKRKCKHVATSIALHPHDDNTIAYGCEKGCVNICVNGESGVRTYSKLPIEKAIPALVFSQDGKQLAAIRDKNILIYKTEKIGLTHKVPLEFIPQQITFSQDGNRLFFGNCEYTEMFSILSKWSVQVMISKENFLGRCTALAIDNAGRAVFGCDNGLTAVNLDYNQKDCTKKIPIEKIISLSGADLQTAQKPFFTLEDFNKQLSQVESSCVKTSREKRVTALALHDAQKKLLVGLQHGQIVEVSWCERSYELGVITKSYITDKLVRKVKPPVEKAMHIIKVSDEEASSGLQMKVLTPTGYEIQHLKMNSDGNMFASMSANGELQVWKAVD